MRTIEVASKLHQKYVSTYRNLEKAARSYKKVSVDFPEAVKLIGILIMPCTFFVYLYDTYFTPELKKVIHLTGVYVKIMLKL